MDHNVTIGAKVKAFRTAKKYTLKQNEGNSTRFDRGLFPDRALPFGDPSGKCDPFQRRGGIPGGAGDGVCGAGAAS